MQETHDGHDSSSVYISRCQFITDGYAGFTAAPLSEAGIPLWEHPLAALFSSIYGIIVNHGGQCHFLIDDSHG
jgi:hypothetical protein